ncbi:VanW family protein [Candidatus Uhrbacteria bacterium]|nr:VanW family protein [Candidatus Uhrbacteria bacterium]
MSIAKRYPRIAPVCALGLQAKRRLAWHLNSKKYAGRRTAFQLPVVIFRHQSVLIRKLGNADLRLQRNKVTNLKLAARRINSVTIRPGETFSLWKLVGRPTARKGYVEGLLLANGEVTSGIGGGLCQMANLLHWMFLHTPLTVTEKFHHGFDAFPDSGRTVPFGTGATLFYNYVDLQCHNPTDQTFQITVWVTDEHLKGEIRSDRDIPERYHIIERDHRFLRRAADGKHFRANRIFRERRETSTGRPLGEELLMDNFCEMKYEPPAEAVVETI